MSEKSFPNMQRSWRPSPACDRHLLFISLALKPGSGATASCGSRRNKGRAATRSVSFPLTNLCSLLKPVLPHGL